MRLFQFVVIYKPTVEDRLAGDKPQVVVPIKEILADDDRAALLQAAMLIPESYRDKLDRLEVAVRPF